ncbi:flavodoxin family protein [Lacticaseibacillus brantae]|nr:NAD(P)H-dependent oxidoreductase [Lacticaseibacillus brantae]
MHILGIFGGQAADGATMTLMKTVLAAVPEPNTTEIIDLNDWQLRPQGRELDALEAKLAAADVWVLASPTYFSTIAGQMKQFLDVMRPRLVRMTQAGDTLPGQYKDKHYLSISSCFASGLENTFTHQTDQTFRTLDKAMTAAGLHKITELVLPNTWANHTDIPTTKLAQAQRIGGKLGTKTRKDDETLKRYLLLFMMIAVMALATMGIQLVLPVLTSNFWWRYISFVLIFFVLLACLLHYFTFVRHKRR